MNIAVIGDLHGLVWEALRLGVRLQEEIGVPLAAMLCTGDLGYFPDAARLDPSTRKHAAGNPDELGFLARFAQPTPEVSEWLAGLPIPPPKLYFVRGNHEDHFALEPLHDTRHPTPVDAYQLVHYLPDNAVLELKGGDGEAIKIIGLGGVEVANPRKYHRLRMLQEASVAEILDRGPCSTDVLLTHDAPARLRERLGHDSRRPRREVGSELVDLVADELQPTYHFLGHWHRQLDCWSVGATTFCPLNIVRRRQDQRAPSPHCLGLLRWQGRDSHDFAYVNAPWLAEWRWAPAVALDGLL